MALGGVSAGQRWPCNGARQHDEAAGHPLFFLCSFVCDPANYSVLAPDLMAGVVGEKGMNRFTTVFHQS